MAILVQSNKKPSVTFPSQTGSIVTFNSQYAGLPLKSCKIAVTATQSGSGTPSPDNVRNINGWDAINIFGVGGNVWNEETRNGYYHTSGGYYVNVAGQLCCKTPIDVLPNTTYRFCKPNTLGDVLFYDENGTYLNQSVTNVRKNGTFTTPSGCYKININLGNNYGATYNDDVIIAYPAGDKFTIQIGSTVYGGEYDARTGVLTVTHLGVDMGSLTWEKYTAIQSPYIIFFTTLTGRKQDTDILVDNCEFMGNYSSASIAHSGLTHDYSLGGASSSNSFRAYVRIDSATTASDVVSALSSHYLVYELATPTTIQLPPCPIDTLQGVNNLWADTGNTTAQYIKIGG